VGGVTSGNSGGIIIAAKMVSLIEQHRTQLLELCRKYDVSRLDIFGSAARGDFDAQRSDIDFLVEFNNFTIHNAADRYFDLLFDLESLFDRKIHLVSDSAISNPYFRRAVDAERVNLYAA
jgi:predicted nucleotidyltransferase